MLIEIDRNSVCMGDDCMSHRIKREFPDDSRLSEFFDYLVKYVIDMSSSVWVVRSLNSIDNTLGYIIRDKKRVLKLDTQEDKKLKEIFVEDLDDLSVVCIYFPGINNSEDLSKLKDRFSS